MSERPVAIVTGGSAGIGATICRQMIDAGYEAVSVARRKPDWSHAALHAVEVDLTDAKATEQAAADLARRFPISTVVHNAGIIRPNLLADVRQEDLATSPSFISGLQFCWYRRRCRACVSGTTGASC